MNDSHVSTSQSAHHRRGSFSAPGWTHVGDAVREFLAELQAEAEQKVEGLGGFVGPMRKSQKPWSQALDAIAGEEAA